MSCTGDPPDGSGAAPGRGQYGRSVGCRREAAPSRPAGTLAGQPDRRVAPPSRQGWRAAAGGWLDRAAHSPVNGDSDRRRARVWCHRSNGRPRRARSWHSGGVVRRGRRCRGAGQSAVRWCGARRVARPRRCRRGGARRSRAPRRHRRAVAHRGLRRGESERRSRRCRAAARPARSSARARRGRLVVGAALAPGLSGVLARHLADRLAVVDEIHVATHGTAGPGVRATAPRCARRPRARVARR